MNLYRTWRDDVADPLEADVNDEDDEFEEDDDIVSVALNKKIGRNVKQTPNLIDCFVCHQRVK